MNRNLAVAALAAAILSAGAFHAAAAPGMLTTFGKTYTLACDVNGFDGTALKARVMVKNATGKIIPQGATIALRFAYRAGQRPTGPTTQNQVAYRQVGSPDSIGFDKPRGALSCTATVTLKPNISTRVKVTR